MGSFILKVAGAYIEWSTITDAPVTFGMTREEFEAHYREQNGAQGMKELPARLARVDATGTSSMLPEHQSADDVMWLNRAGRGMALSKAEIIRWFVRERRNPTKAGILAWRAGLPKCEPCIDDHGDGTGSRCACWGSGVLNGGARTDDEADLNASNAPGRKRGRR